MDAVDAIAARPNRDAEQLAVDPVAMTKRHRQHPVDRPAQRRRRPHDQRNDPTDKGDIDVDIFTTGAPKAAKNFLDLAKKGFYDDVIFHRVIPGFVIQGGDGQHGKKARSNRAASGPAAPATSSRTSRSRATTTAARWRWRTPARTRTAASSSSATRT